MTRIDRIPLPKLWLLFILATLALAGCGAPSSQSQQASQTSHDTHSTKATPAVADPTPRIPAYFEKLEEAMPLPKVLDPKQFSTPVVARAYGYARENPELFALQPCYCYCDQGNGHRSLLDCYATDHSAG